MDNEKNISKRNPFLAGIFNLIAPGLGFFYCGKFELGIVIALALPFIGVFIDLISTYLPPKFNAYFYLIPELLIIITLIVLAVILAIKRKNYIIQPKNKTFYYIIFIICAALYSNIISGSSFKNFPITMKSMENTLLVNEKVLVRMNYYGVFVPSLQKKIINFTSPKREEVVLYFSPELNKENNSNYSLHRIIAQPGDTLQIINKICYVNGMMENQKATYKYDNEKREPGFDFSKIYPNGAPWNVDYYGPLYIPKAGDKIKINSSNLLYWEQLILEENSKENQNIIKKVLNTGEYIVKQNYYFLLGDSRNESYDSRYAGLIPEKLIVGKVEFILINPKDISNERTGLKIH